MTRAREYEGLKFGCLTVIKRVGSVRNEAAWLCSCDCGNEIIKTSKELTQKTQKYCAKCFKGSVRGYGEIPLGYWNRVITQAKMRNLLVEITIEEAWDVFLKQNRKCALSGVELVFGQGSKGTASLDRVDNSKDYTLNNVQWLHKDVNKMKNTHHQDVFLEWCRKISNEI